MSEKLVRDRMPEVCGTTPGKTAMKYRYAREEERPRLLANKLLEEADELYKACNRDDKMEIAAELADLLEVVRAIVLEYEVSGNYVEKLRRSKFKARGGFTKGIVWDGKK